MREEGTVYLTNPPKYRCKRCGQWWFTGDEVSECRKARMKPKKTSWEDDFVNRWLPIHAHHGNPPEDVTEEILAFIRKVRQEAIGEVLEEVRIEPVDVDIDTDRLPFPANRIDYNQAVSDLEAKIAELRKKESL